MDVRTKHGMTTRKSSHFIIFLFSMPLILTLCPCIAPAEESQPDSQIKEMCQRLGSNDDGVRWKAAKQLIDAGPKATPLLSTILLGEWAEGRKLAAYILGETKDPGAVPALAKSLGDDEFHVRWKCAVGLKNIGKQSVDALVGALGNGNLNAQYCAAWALGEIRDPVATLPLAKAATAKDEELRWKAVIALKRIGRPAVAGLKNLLHDANVESRRCAVWSLGEMGGNDVVAPLIEAAGDADAEVRGKAAAALSHHNLPQVRAALEKLAEDKDQSVQKQAVMSLAKLGKTDEMTARKGVGDDHVPQWQVYEIVYDPAAEARPAAKPPAKNLPPPNPANQKAAPAAELAPPARNGAQEPSLEVTLLTPTQGSRTIRGFFADGAWRARMAPDQPGEWFYKLAFTAGGKTDTRHGMFSCDASDLRPALTVKAKPRPHLDAAGKPTLLVEAPVPAGNLPTSLDTWKPLIDACSAHGLNLLRLDLSRLLLYPAADEKQAAWKFLDAVIPYGHGKGVYFLLTLFDESLLRTQGFGPLQGDAVFPAVYDPTSPLTAAIQEDYIGGVLARTAGNANVLFELCRDFNTNGAAVPFGRGWVQKRAELFRECPRPLMISVAGGGDDAAVIGSVDGVQIAGSAAPERIKDRLAALSARCPATPSEALAQAWLAFVGSGAIVSWSSTPVTTLEQATTFIEQAGEGARVLAQYATNEDFYLFHPDPTVVLAAPPGVRVAARVDEKRATVFLAGEGNGGEMVRIGMAAGQFTVRWMDIRSGTYQEPVEGKQDRGAIELQCPRFTGGILAEIEVH